MVHQLGGSTFDTCGALPGDALHRHTTSSKRRKVKARNRPPRPDARIACLGMRSKRRRRGTGMHPVPKQLSKISLSARTVTGCSSLGFGPARDVFGLPTRTSRVSASHKVWLTIPARTLPCSTFQLLRLARQKEYRCDPVDKPYALERDVVCVVGIWLWGLGTYGTNLWSC